MRRRKKRKNQVQSVQPEEQLSLFDNVTLGIQESTMQVPCGAYSILDPALKVPAFNQAVYLIMNWKSQWEYGITHAISNSTIGKCLGVKCKSQVNRAVKWLIKHGWVEVEGKRKSDGAFFYKLTHHNCEPHQVPLDKHNLPKKCAVPMGIGSAFEKVAQGLIKWRVLVQWVISKIHSDWETGRLFLTVRETLNMVRFTAKTIIANTKAMIENNLLVKKSANYRAGEYEIKPSPYLKRRTRQLDKHKVPGALPYINGWYYSFNKQWRFQRGTHRLQMRPHELDKWRDTSIYELERINPKIHRDFLSSMEALDAIARTRD